jgi:hypothetical protein
MTMNGVRDPQACRPDGPTWFTALRCSFLPSVVLLKKTATGAFGGQRSFEESSIPAHFPESNRLWDHRKTWAVP